MTMSDETAQAGYTKVHVTVLTIPVQHTAGRNNRKGGAVHAQANVETPPDECFGCLGALEAFANTLK